VRVFVIAANRADDRAANRGVEAAETGRPIEPGRAIASAAVEQGARRRFATYRRAGRRTVPRRVAMRVLFSGTTPGGGFAVKVSRSRRAA